MGQVFSAIARALLEQRRLRARLDELERARYAPIAVVGLGCRLPGGANSPAALWKLLANGVDAIGDLPARRRDLGGRGGVGGFLDGIDLFDPHVFGISPSEAEAIDPQQRVLLEVVWEALAHAGCPPDRLRGSETGVFVGIGANDYFWWMNRNGAAAEADLPRPAGHALGLASGRISSMLGLQGPSISVDTASSASLMAVHLACESLRARSCDAAIAGGVGLLLSEERQRSLDRAHLIAADGRCKTFDARADGFVRSEGCGIVVLKRLSDARRDGDRVLALIRGTACNQDVHTNGSAANGPAQEAVMRAALANAGVAPAEVSYVETHGIGTALGDPIEVSSIAAVMGSARGHARPLMLGSVKTNLGHLEAAAGVAGLIKTVLALQHRAIPPNLHFKTPNPHFNWDAHPFVSVPTALTPWEVGDGHRVAGVSAFGFTGTNVHLVLEEAPAIESLLPVAERPVHLLAVSGATDAALRAAARDLVVHFETDVAALADTCFSVNTGRPTLAHRAAVRASNSSELATRLRNLASGTPDAGVRTGVAAPSAAPRVVWYFPDVPRDSRGSGPARELYATHPIFRAAVGACGPASSTSETFAVQYGLTLVWKSLGVTPDTVVAHGAGQYAAAVAAGRLPFEDALKLSATRTPAFGGAWMDAGAAERCDAVLTAAAGDAATVVMEFGAQWPTEPCGAGARVYSIAADGRDWDALVAAVAELFVRGVSIDWRGFDRDQVTTRVDVPALPWMRERCWFTAPREDRRRHVR